MPFVTNLCQLGSQNLPGFLVVQASQLANVEVHALLVQELLTTHMGMHVDSMQQFAGTSPAERSSLCLPDAHLPKRGFYRIKSAAASQLQKQPEPCPPPFRILSCLGFKTSKASSSSILTQSGDNSDIDKASLDTMQEGIIDLEGQGHEGLVPVKIPLNL